MPVAQKLKQARLGRGLSLTRLAAASGLSKGFLSQVESGATNPSLASLERLAAALSLSVSELLSDAVAESGAGSPYSARLVRRAPGEFGRSNVAQVGTTSQGVAYVAHLGPAAHLEPANLSKGDAYLMVLSGEVKFTQLGTALSVAEGDSLSFPLSEQYLLIPQTGRRASLLLVLPSERALPRVVEAPVKLDLSPARFAEKSSRGEGPLRLVEMRAARSSGRGR